MAMNLDEVCRRQWKLRTAGIRTVIERRRTALAEADGNITDKERLDRDSVNRMLRAKGAGGTEK